MSIDGKVVVPLSLTMRADVAGMVHVIGEKKLSDWTADDKKLLLGFATLHAAWELAHKLRRQRADRDYRGKHHEMYPKRVAA